jgi:hypothetical protein
MAEAKPIKWKDHHVVYRIQYEDGTGDLCNVTFANQPGVQIVGNGSLQAPLKVECEDGFALLRKDDIYAPIRKLFETFPGWRKWDAEYDPNDLLEQIARIVGEPLDTPDEATK